MKKMPQNHQPVDKSFERKPRIIQKNYHVTAQTAYHITQMALACNTSEGRIIDKLMRNYLASQNQSF